MIVGESYRAGFPSISRWLRQAGSPQTTQIACSLSTTSAAAMRSPIAPNGSPRKSVSVPARITRTPRPASRVATVDDVTVEKLGFVDGDDLGIGPDQAEDLRGRVNRRRLELGAVVARDAVQAGISIIEMGLEDLHPPACDDTSAHPPDQLLALPAEHDAADHLDPTGVHPIIHRRFSASGWSGTLI